MPNAADTLGTVFVNGTAALLARVVGYDAAPVVQADISAIEYTIFELDDTDATVRTPVDGHEAVSLIVADVIFDTLQTDGVWTADAEGYNFLHIVDITSTQAFTTVEKQYLVEFSLTPVAGQPILVRFRISVI